MLYQLIIGSIVMVTTIIIAAAGFWVAEGVVTRSLKWAVRKPHAPKLTFVLVCTVLQILLIFTASVWVWAFAFLKLGVFDALEPAVYFSTVAFTTLGYGDVILSEEWRILGGLAAANGLLNMGLYTALLVEVLRRVRSEQTAHDMGLL